MNGRKHAQLTKGYQFIVAHRNMSGSGRFNTSRLNRVTKIETIKKNVLYLRNYNGNDGKIWKEIKKVGRKQL
jgi:hypothetical protein